MVPCAETIDPTQLSWGVCRATVESPGEGKTVCAPYFDLGKFGEFPFQNFACRISGHLWDSKNYLGTAIAHHGAGKFLHFCQWNI